jgi:hypothetical protein
MELNSELIESLLHGEIIHVPALPFRREGFYADVALVTTAGSVKVVAEGFDLPSGEEAFFLNLDSFDPEAYWVNKDGESAWSPNVNVGGKWRALDLASLINEAGLKAVLKGNRTVKFYRNFEATRADMNSRGILRSAAAIVLGSNSSDQCVVIYASPELACSVELAWGRPRVSQILTSLEEFELTDHAAPQRQ